MKNIRFFNTPPALRFSTVNINTSEKCFFLDMNGTLTESKHYEIKAHYHTLEHFKHTHNLKYPLPDPQEFEMELENLFSANSSFKVESLFPELKFLSREYSAYAESYFEKIRKKAGLNYFLPSTVNFLKYLVDHHDSVCLVSGSNRNSIARNLSLLGLEKTVPYIGREDYQKSKPDPQPYLIAAQRMNIIPNKKNCIAVENSEYGITSAKKASMFTIGLARNPLLREKLLSAGADLVVNDLQEIGLVSKGLRQKNYASVLTTNIR